MSVSLQEQTVACGKCGGHSCRCASDGSHPNPAFSRPNFFAGQLLTDEDLRDAMDYFVQKNRLHNKHFMGEGVVCGLRVDPHPCPDSRQRVVVRAGHAINGCGEDIVVQQQEVNVLKLVQDLITRERGGYECRDSHLSPSSGDRNARVARLVDLKNEIFENRKKLDKKNLDVLNTDVLRATVARQVRELADLEERIEPQEFGLYVKYSEQPTGFVSSYATDRCDQPSCHGSRIAEGYEFEVRPKKTTVHGGMKSVLDECAKVIPDFEKLQAKTLHGLSALETAHRILIQFAELENIFGTPTDLPFGDWSDEGIENQIRKKEYFPDSLRELEIDAIRKLGSEALKALPGLDGSFRSLVGGWIDIIGEDPPFQSFDDGKLEQLRADLFLPIKVRDEEDDDLKALSKADLLDLIPDSAAFTRVLVVVSAWFADIEPAIKSAEASLKAFSSSPTIAHQRRATRDCHAMVTLASRVLQFVSREQLDDANIIGDLKSAIGLLETTLPILLDVSSQENAVKEPVLNLLCKDRAAELLPLIKAFEDGDTTNVPATFDVRSRIVGEMLSSKDLANNISKHNSVFRDLDNVKSRLTGFIASGQIRLSPDLREALFGTQLAIFNGDSHVTNEETFKSIRSQANTINRAVAEVARQCMCDALIPPCPDDSEAAVLLANVSIANGEVREICNLARRMILTAPSLRYWFSDFESVIKPLRDACCLPGEGETSLPKNMEDKRQKDLVIAWKKGAHPSNGSPFIPNWIQIQSGDGSTETTADYLERARLWMRLNYDNGDLLDQLAVEPTKPALELLGSLDDDNKTASARRLSPVIAKLSGLPETDLRNLLAWSEDFGSPALVRQTASEAKRIAIEIKKQFESPLEGSDQTLSEYVTGQLATDVGGSSSLREFVVHQLMTQSGGKTLREFVDSQLSAKAGELGDQTLRDYVSEQLESQVFTTGQSLRTYVETLLPQVVAFADSELSAKPGELDDKSLRQFVKDQLDDPGSLRGLVDNVVENQSFDHDGDDSTDDLLIKEFLEAYIPAIRQAVHDKLDNFRDYRSAVREPLGLDPETDDNLQRIEGIGPRAENALLEADVRSFAAVAAKTPDELRQILEDASVRGNLNTSTWPKQAGLAASGDFDALAELQGRIRNGNETPPPGA